MLFKKKRKKKLGANSSQSSFIKRSFPEEGTTLVILTSCWPRSFCQKKTEACISLFSRNAQPPARLLEQGLPLEGELLQSEDNVLGLTGRPRIGLVPSGG